MEKNLTQTQLDFKDSPCPELEVTLDLISAFVIISGFFGNILNAIVWYTQRGRTPTYLYFIAISISNTLYCIFYFLKYSLDTFGFLQKSLEADLCKNSYDRWRYFIFHPCKEIFLTAAIYYSVGLSAERYAGITKPLQFNYLCTRTRTYRIITILSFLSIAINLPLFFEYVHDAHNESMICRKPEKSALRKDPIYIWTYRVCLENLVKFLIPFVLMFIFNVGIIKALKRSRMFRQSMSERKRSSTGVVNEMKQEPKPPIKLGVEKLEGNPGEEGEERDEEVDEDVDKDVEKNRVQFDADDDVDDDKLRKTPSPANTPKTPRHACPHHASLPSPRQNKLPNHKGKENPASSKSSSDKNVKFPSLKRLCSCFFFTSENQKLSFLATCYVSVFLIFILPAVTRRGLFALRSAEFSGIDTDELDYFRWISYFLDAVRPSIDFLLYIVVSSKFRASFVRLVTSPCTVVAKTASVVNERRKSSLQSGRKKGSLLCCGKEEDEDEPLELSEVAPFNRRM